jgi:hypothetical protein
MKIINRKAFLAIEGEVLYSNFSPMIFEGLNIKCGNAGNNDFIYQPIIDAIDSESSERFFEAISDSQLNGGSMKMDFFDSVGRDGTFDEDALFAVWERADVEALMTRLGDVLSGGRPESHTPIGQCLTG